MESNVHMIFKSCGGGGTITWRSLSFIAEYKAAQGEYCVLIKRGGIGGRRRDGSCVNINMLCVYTKLR